MIDPDVQQVEITEDGLVAGFRRLGVSAGDKVIVHSSMKSLGKVVGGPPAVIQALMDVLTADGTLVMPSFNQGKAFVPGQPGLFDPLTTPTINGLIPQTFWQMPGVCRSLHPTHSFAAWGKDAEAFVKDHHRTLTCGADSPLGRLADAGGYGLLIGVDYRANTYHHVVETALGVPCLGQRTTALPMRLPDGRIVEGRTWTWRAQGCPVTDPGCYAAEMERRGVETRAIIGQSLVRRFRLSDCFGVVAACLADGLGKFPPCQVCPVRPAQTPRSVPSDWDETTGRLLPDSPAWSYAYK